METEKINTRFPNYLVIILSVLMFFAGMFFMYNHKEKEYELLKTKYDFSDAENKYPMCNKLYFLITSYSGCCRANIAVFDLEHNEPIDTINFVMDSEKDKRTFPIGTAFQLKEISRITLK